MKLASQLRLLFWLLLVASLGGNAYLWKANEKLHEELTVIPGLQADLDQLRTENSEMEKLRVVASEVEQLRKEAGDVLRLRSEVRGLRIQAAEADKLRAQVTQLSEGITQARQSLAEQTKVAVATQAELEAKQREDQSNACIGNLKQIGLAAFIWAGDNNRVFPPDFISMTNELNTPKILFCPADASAKVVAEWSQLNQLLVSYRLMNPGGKQSEPEKVLAMCPIHNHMLLSDGSVQRGRQKQ